MQLRDRQVFLISSNQCSREAGWGKARGGGRGAWQYPAFWGWCSESGGQGWVRWISTTSQGSRISAAGTQHLSSGLYPSQSTRYWSLPLWHHKLRSSRTIYAGAPFTVTGPEELANSCIVRSACPFDYGWCPAVRLTFMCKECTRRELVSMVRWKAGHSDGKHVAMAVWNTVGILGRGMNQQNFKNWSTITMMTVWLSEGGRSVMKSTAMCDHGWTGTGEVETTHTSGRTSPPRLPWWATNTAWRWSAVCFGRLGVPRRV